MTAYQLNLIPGLRAGSIGPVGGPMQLPVSTEWPKCRLCEVEMIGFLEIVLPVGPSGTFQPGSRLQIFACREHDEIPGTIYSNFSTFESASRQQKLPSDYWDITDGHYLLRLLPPSAKTAKSPFESRLIVQSIMANPVTDDHVDGLKMFGEPNWLQDAERHTCSCGKPMKLLLQIPEAHGFPMADGAEPQPNSFSRREYGLFLGNQLDLLACTGQCHPQALWPVVQN